MGIKKVINNQISSIANRFEPYIKTDLGYVLRGGAWISAVNIFGSIISFVLFIFIARYVSKEVYGIYKYIISIVSIAGAFSLTGINLAVTRSVAQGIRGIFKNSILLQLRWVWLQILVTLGIGGYYFLKGNNTYAIAFGILSVLAPVALIANTYRSFLSGEKKFKTLSIYNFISSLLYFVVMALFFVFLSDSFIWLLVGFYGIGAITNTIWSIVVFRRDKKFEQKKLSQEDISYAKHLSVINVLGSVTTYVDSIVLYYFLGPTSLATYSFAVSVPERIKGLFNFIPSLAFPKITERYQRGEKVAVARKVFQLIVLGLIISFIYSIIAPFVFNWLFPQYADAIPYSQIYSISLIALALHISTTVLSAQNNKKGLYFTNTVNSIIQSALMIIGILFGGIWGAIVARLIGQTLLIISTTYFAEKG